ncbi:MAG TPA: 6-bladed beta-propeller [Ignavibacteriaceae bacterium]|nr:6-bladed beta-propeller [Ignavibacteriaceae bacterium]
MKKIILFSILAFTLLGIIFLFFDNSQQKQITSNYSIPVDIHLEILSKSEKFEDLFEQEQKILLEGIYIGDIKKLKALPDGNIGIIDASTKKLNIFDSNGKYLKTIGGTGNGPGEYVYPTDFLLDDSLNFYILDPPQMRLIRYNVSGKYQSSLNIDKYSEHMALFNTKLFLYSTISMLDRPSGYCLDIRNNKKEFEFAEPSGLLKSLIKKNNLSLSVNSNSMECYEGNIYLIHPYQYAIREFNENGVLKRTILCESKYFYPYDSTKQFNPLKVDPKQYFKSAVNGIKIFKNVIIISFIDIIHNKVYFDFYSLSGSKLNIVSIELPSSKFNRNIYFPFFIDSRNSFYFYSFENSGSNKTDINPYIIKYKPLFIK